MTEKRFELCDVDLYEYGMPLNEIMDNGVPLSQKQVCELLNELHEENEQLKKEIQNSIEMLQTEKETAISSNERIRLDFAITVLEELKGDVE